MKKILKASILKYNFIIGFCSLSVLSMTIPTSAVYAAWGDWSWDIDMEFTDVNGKKWHIKGTVSGHFFELTGYDVVVTDPSGGTHHFVKRAILVPTGDNSGDIYLDIDGLGQVYVGSVIF